MKIIDFYKSILSLGNLTADQDGMVSAEMNGTKIPLMVNAKRMVLPTQAHMSNPNKDEVVLFHPLAENIMRGESDVMAKFRSTINIKLNYTIGVIIEELTILATSPGMHSRLKADQFEFLALLKESDAKTVEAFQAVIKAMSIGNTEKCFVHLYVKKNAMINGKNFRRGAIVTFPAYEDMVKSEVSVFGIKLRKKDFAAFKAILEYIFPKINEKDAYSQGNISETAPTLDALLLGVLRVASHLNSMIENYESVLDDLTELKYDDEWVPELENLAQFTNELRLIPMQAGNEGASPGVTTTAVPPAGQLQNVAPPVAHVPYQAPAPLQQQQPQYINPSQMQQQSGVNVVKTTNGIDFAATMRNNPQLAPPMINPYGGMYPQAMPPGPIAARNGAPAWDRPNMAYPPQQQMYPNGQPMGMGGYNNMQFPRI